MINYNESLHSAAAMGSSLRFGDVPIAEALLMRYVDASVAYLEKEFEGTELDTKLKDLYDEVITIMTDFELVGIAATQAYNFLSRKRSGI